MGEAAPERAAAGLPEPSAQAQCLFGSMPLTPEQRILIEMSLREADPHLAKFAWLLGGNHQLLEQAFLVPMERWGASETFEPMRQHERAWQLALAWHSLRGLASPACIWRPAPTAAPPRRWRAGLWALMAAQSPLSFFGSLLALQGLHAAGILPAWAFLLASVALPLALSVAERALLFKFLPGANLAAWIAARWIAPQPMALEDMARRARDCASSFECHECIPEFISAPSFAPGAYKGEFLRKTATMLNFGSLEALLADLRSKGMDPRVDAALAALAQQEICALDQALQGLDRSGPAAQKHSRL